jgi:hypothetical protein
MIRAFGWCSEPFDPLSPGRLCRGRERWVEGLPDMPPSRLHRTVMSGAVFSDDSARDALRGFCHAGVSAGRLLLALFPGTSLWAFREAGDPRALPAKMLLEEDYQRGIFGGARSEPAVRWVAQPKVDEVDDWIVGEKDGLACPRADGLVLVKGQPSPALLEKIFLLTGYSEPDDRPARRYNPTALPLMLEEAAAVVLLHLDKHAPALALYTNNPLPDLGMLQATAKNAGSFPVPFAIPPMLARWDRALYELRMHWDSAAHGDFPIPPAEDSGGRWSMRRRMLEEAEARQSSPEEEEPQGEE